MAKPGPVSEALAAILWAASAVKVAGYTWQAYTGTRVPFPTPEGGGGNIGSAAANTVGDVVGFGSKIPIVGPVFGFAAKGWHDIGKLISGG